MHLKPIAMACLVAMLGAGCGGSSKQNGQTMPTSGAVASAYLLACVDSNHNWQCDDADTSRKVEASGATGLAPGAGERVLIEGRDASNQRVSLLASDKGSAEVTGTSTLRAVLNLGPDSALEQALVARHGDALAATLETGYAAALAAHPIGVTTLAAYSAAVQTQASATPTGSAPAPTIGAASVAASWSVPSADAAGNRQLSAQVSTVLGSNESNRLYVFDPSAAVVDARQIDLIPAADTVTASRRVPSNRWMAALDRLVSVFVDTASAASSVAGAPTPPVTIPPGRGIVGAALAGNATQAVVLMNLGVGKYADSHCAGAGSEGLFRVGLDASDTTGYRLLAQAPACVHSGFSLIASDPGAARIVAWDATARQLWSIDGETMKERALFALQVPLAPTAMAVSAGGRYAAVAGSDASGNGQLAIVDLDAGRVLATLQGAWPGPARVAFADGVRQVLVTSGATVTAITLDNALQLASSRTIKLPDEVRDLAVSPDGSSFVATTAGAVSWRALATGEELASASLPSGFAVQRIAIAGSELVAQGVQAAQGSYNVVRLPISLAPLPN